MAPCVRSHMWWNRQQALPLYLHVKHSPWAMQGLSNKIPLWAHLRSRTKQERLHESLMVLFFPDSCAGLLTSGPRAQNRTHAHTFSVSLGVYPNRSLFCPRKGDKRLNESLPDPSYTTGRQCRRMRKYEKDCEQCGLC